MSQQIADMIFAVAFVRASENDLPDTYSDKEKSVFFTGVAERARKLYLAGLEPTASARNPKNDAGQTLSEWLSEAEWHMEALDTHNIRGEAVLAWEGSCDPLMWGLEKRRELGMRGVIPTCAKCNAPMVHRNGAVYTCEVQSCAFGRGKWQG